MELEGRLALGLAEAAEDDAVGEEVDEKGAGEAGGEEAWRGARGRLGCASLNGRGAAPPARSLPRGGAAAGAAAPPPATLAPPGAARAEGGRKPRSSISAKMRSCVCTHSTRWAWPTGRPVASPASLSRDVTK